MAEHQLCSNCQREIPVQNYRMHTLHCARNITLCSDCQEPIPIHDLEAHREEMHSMQPCTLCGQNIEACKMTSHQAGSCAGQTTLCRYCATHVERGSLEEHENYCGSRTDKCKDCGEYIMIKNFELHISSNHGFIKLNDEPGPKPSWERSVAKHSSVSNSSSYSALSRFSKYSDPEPSTPKQRANFTATELFNNQDLYSSRRFTSSSSSSSSSTLLKSSSSSVVGPTLSKSTSHSIVDKVMKGGEVPRTNGLVASKSSSVVSSLARASEDTEIEKLPCEFCEAMIPMYKLLSHQAECVNPSNVRGSTSSSTTPYRAYSSLRDSVSYRDTGVLRESTSIRENSVSRSSSLNAGADSCVISKYLRQSSTSTPQSETPASSASRYSSNGASLNGDSKFSPHKVSPGSSSIVNRYISSPEPYSNGSKHIPDSPPFYENNTESSIYMGRSSYLRKEKEECKKESVERKPYTAKTTTTPGLYENDADREGLRQMLSGLRRDPMDVEEDPDNNDGSFFPCEFCGDPYPSEFIMRHQMSCDLNPRPVSSGNGFDYSQIQKSIARNLGIEAPAPVVRKTSAEDPRQTSQLSRSNSVIEKSYSRSARASSVSRTSSFADRSYGTRTNLARKSSFSIADYSSAVRRSSVFDGYAGYSIYSSISEGLDQITYGGRTSRRNSITEMTYSFSRRGSVSGGSDYPLPALMAALDASKASQEDRREKLSSTAQANAHVNGQAAAYLNGGQSYGYSRQNSSNDSPRAIDSPFGAVNGHHMELQKSDSKSMVRRVSSVKHSQSGHKLERKVSFHNHDHIINNDTVDDNGVPIEKPDKPKRKKERTEEEKAARKERKEKKEKKRMDRGESKDRKCRDELKNKQHPSGGDLVQQLSAKLQDIEREQNKENSDLGPLPSSSLLHQLDSQASNPPPPPHASANLASFHQTTTSNPNPLNGHLSSQVSDNKLTVNPLEEKQQQRESGGGHEEMDSVTLRDLEGRGSKMGSKRNSLDNRSVQSLAKDLAAECAKAYELMESSLSKLTNDFSIGPFGLTPKNKKKYRAPQPPPLK